jgi:WD40 repeat protein
MPAFDRDLTDPGADELVKMMVQAVETANKRCRVGKIDPVPDEYRRFVAKEFADKPEGVQLWLGGQGRVKTYPPNTRATLLGLAWWTNPLGKRLVRVVGRRIEPFNDAPTHRFGPPGEQWPPLCYLDPDHMVLSTLARKKRELIALCDCGAVGSPASLGWAGGSCGPCHDHREEHGTPLAAGDGPVLIRSAKAIVHVAWSPSGRTVVGVVYDGPDAPGWICFWERATGKLIEKHEHSFNTYGSDAPFTVGGKWCVAEGGSGCRIWDRETGKLIRQWPGDGEEGLSFLALAPDGRTLAGSRLGYYEAVVEVRDLQGRGRAPWKTHWSRDGEEICGALAYSPDGKTLAVAINGTIELIDWPSGESRSLVPKVRDDELDDHRIETLAFSGDGSLLATGSGLYAVDSVMEFEMREESAESTGFVHLYDAKSGKFLAGFTPTGTVHAVAFTPDGKYLVHAGADRQLHFIDLVTRKETAVLEGPISTIRCLAFSPDGQTLAVGSGDGCVRFWPWRQFLERPTSHRKR